MLFRSLQLGMGAFFSGLTAMTDPTARRRPQMLVLGVMIALGPLLGGSLSPFGYWGVLALALLALPAGSLAAAGARAATAGTVLLGVFSVNQGLQPQASQVPVYALLSLAGSLLMIVVIEGWSLLLRRSPDNASPDEATPIALLREHAHLSDRFVRHALRLAGAEVVAGLLAHLLGIDHAYWIPLTVAFVLLPNRSGTASQVIARLMGTMLGIGLLLAPLTFHPHVGIGTVVAVFLGALLSYAFGPLNYAFAVAGLTITVLSLDAFIGEPVLTTAPIRSLCTIIAGVICAGVWLTTGPERRQATASSSPMGSPPAGS